MTQATPSLPARPNLAYLKKLSRDRLRELRRTDGNANLAAARLLVARAHGFSSWRTLKQRVDIATPPTPAVKKPLRSPEKRAWKPIMDAAFRGDANEVCALLVRRADPNVVSGTSHRYRPLHRAIEFKKSSPRNAGHEAVVRVLLARGADPKQRVFGHTALQLAAIGETRFVPMLRRHFEPLDIFHAAALADDERLATLLKDDPALANVEEANHWRPLHYCAASAMHRRGPESARCLARIATLLLDAGADPAAAYHVGPWLLRAIYEACGRSNNAAVARVLLEAGVDPCDNESVYHAADEGHAECLALIEQFVEPKKLAREATKCLATQLNWGRTRGMRWLLEHGADPNALHAARGDSALHEAIRNGSSEAVVKLLLKHGADPRAKNRAGKSAIQLAKSAKKTAILKLLERGATRAAERGLSRLHR